jgi:predicted DNA-binding transcriptional regulator AlpA
MTSRLICKKDVAELLGVHPVSVMRFAADNDNFPNPIKPGGKPQSRVFFDAQDIEAWIEARKAQSQTQGGNNV